MKFKLAIELGNAAMQEPGHIADALREVAEKIDQRYGGMEEIPKDHTGRIRDVNGNTVGEWKVTR